MKNVNCDYDKIRYNKNYVSNVIFRIDFEPILILKEEEPIKFQDSIRKFFPGYSKKELVEQIILSNNEKRKFITPIYLFSSKNKKEKITLTFNHIVVEFQKYHVYEELKDKIEKTYNFFLKQYDSIAIKRLGLRYINKIQLSKGVPYNWNGYINSHLTTAVDKFTKNKTDICRAISQLEYNYNTFQLKFIFGMSNDEFPNPITRKEFILDYDCFSHDVEYTEVINKLSDFHNNIQEMFENSIEDKLRKQMEAK
jgi:uncharacterized protein (TIGR04255 family)